MRTEMQSLSLRCDMRAFKAANPGCILADFVRWHSPRDWALDDETSGTTQLGGRLSERMQQPGNLWQTIWDDTSPCPVSKQLPLFDCAKEAELVGKPQRVTLRGLGFSKWR